MGTWVFRLGGGTVDNGGYFAWSLYGVFPVPLGQFVSVTYPRRTGQSLLQQTLLTHAHTKCPPVQLLEKRICLLRTSNCRALKRRLPLNCLHVMSRRPCFSSKFFKKKLFCIDLQHSRLVTWSQTKKIAVELTNNRRLKDKSLYQRRTNLGFY